MTLIQNFNNARTRTSMLAKKPLFLSMVHRPAGNWSTRTLPRHANAPFQGLRPIDIRGMLWGGAPNVPARAVIAQNNVNIYLNIVTAQMAGFNNANVYDLRAYQANPGGALGCQYLSWEDSCIVSMDLSNIGPPLFMSGPFNGCHFYATRNTITNQVRVHHANANQMGMNTGHNRPDLAEAYLDALMAQAQGPNEIITRQMRKANYLTGVWDATAGARVESLVSRAYRRRKAGMGRGNVVLHETMCLVFGVRTGLNAWNFHYHVCGVVDYTRKWRANRVGHLKTIIPWQQM